MKNSNELKFYIHTYFRQSKHPPPYIYAKAQQRAFNFSTAMFALITQTNIVERLEENFTNFGNSTQSYFKHYVIFIYYISNFKVDYKYNSLFGIICAMMSLKCFLRKQLQNSKVFFSSIWVGANPNIVYGNAS